MDRRSVLVAFQLRDAAGNVRVSTDSTEVMLTVAHDSDSSVASVTCDHSGISSSGSHNLGYCHLSELPSAWFAVAGSASVVLELSYDGVVRDQRTLDSIILHAQPAWHGALASESLSGTAYATLPTSPLFPAESFSVNVYANTGGFALSTFWVWLTIDPDAVAYDSFTQSTLFQTVTMDYSGESNQILRFAAVGLQSATTDAMVTDASLLLLTVALRVGADASIGVHTSVTGVLVRQFVNPGSNPFVENADGHVFDDRDSRNADGRLTVRAVEELGLFAYLSSASLGNLAVLTAVAQSYPATVVTTSNDDRLELPSFDVTAEAALAQFDGFQVFLVQGTTVLLNSSLTSGISATYVDAQYKDLAVRLPFSVYFPTDIRISTADNVLHRLDGSSCAASYQWTSATVMVGELDATPLVGFTAYPDGVVATSISGMPDNIVRGISPGSVQLFLKDRSAALASTTIFVRDTPVTVARLVTRLITSVAWLSTPSSLPPNLTPYSVSVRVEQKLTTEGAQGRVFAAIEWSDGAMEELPYALSDTIGVLNLTSRSSNIEVQGSSSDGFSAVVPVGAQGNYLK